MKTRYLKPQINVVKTDTTASILESSMIDAGGKTPSFDAKKGFFEEESDED